MRVTLRTKISAAVFGVVGLTLLTSSVAFLSSRKLEVVLDHTVNDNLPSVRAAEELEIALLEQGVRVSAHLLDEGNPRWLRELPAKRQEFSEWLVRARQGAHGEREQRILADLERVYRKYDATRDEVIDLYRSGDVVKAKRVLLEDAQPLYDEAYQLCEKFVDTNTDYIGASTAAATRDVTDTTRMAAVAAFLTLGLGCGLLWLFYAGVLRPLRQMIQDAHQFTGQPTVGGRLDELGAVGEYLRQLMSDVKETRSDLEVNRQKLSSAEKLATVGRLAASVAHEIRNPLTAVKMWLFSIRSAVVGDSDLDRKLGIISEEITRLEGIVRHFLEFSRPPELKLQRRDLRTIVGQTMELCGSRFQDSPVEVEYQEAPTPLCVVADPEQLRQVLLNLLNNALDATGEGGRIRVSVSGESAHDGRPTGVVRVSDTGCGMPSDVQERIFEPFFSTKQQGTGLGLSIAAQIVARHEGRLVLESSTPQGTTFAMRLPLAKE